MERKINEDRIGMLSEDNFMELERINALVHMTSRKYRHEVLGKVYDGADETLKRAAVEVATLLDSIDSIVDKVTSNNAEILEEVWPAEEYIPPTKEMTEQSDLH